MNDAMDWLNFSRVGGVTTVVLSLFAMPDNFALEKITYGDNKEIPDKERRFVKRRSTEDTERDVARSWRNTLPNIKGPEDVEALFRAVGKFQRDVTAFSDSFILVRDYLQRILGFILREQWLSTLGIVV
ncbi:MAG: hypothetical protein LBP21_09220 [Synergistaceae bacterium]|nr:hypothetical protein [Synergistaceae bacterium]